MKARIRKTGEIVDVICYNNYSTIRSHQDNVSYIDSKGLEHDRESLNYYWDFEPIEINIDEHWQDVKERAAIAAMQGLLSNPGLLDEISLDYRITIERIAVEHADALIEQLKEK